MIKQMIVAIIICGLCVTITLASEIQPQDTDINIVKSIQGLITRRLPNHTEQFRVFAMPRASGEPEIGEIESDAEGNIILRGNTPVAAAVALNAYLRNVCRVETDWRVNNFDLPDKLPPVNGVIRRTTPWQFRNYMNYCIVGYTMPWWDWPQWERLIDWMAMEGVNMPTSITGHEAIYQRVMRRYGLSDDEIRDFLGGPAFLPWTLMMCIDHFGGPLPQSWIDSHLALQKKIFAREVELGMHPVLHGFNGHVPQALLQKFPNLKLQEIRWYGPTPVTYCLSPDEPLFVEIGKAITAEQIKEFGTAHYYEVDSFIEMIPPSSDPAYLASIAKASYESLFAVDPEAVWVLQGWIVQTPARQKFWQPAQAHAFFGAVPDDKMLILDMSRGRFAQEREFFYHKPWLVGLVHNFGDATRMYGDIHKITGNLNAVLKAPNQGKLWGITLNTEGLDYNPMVHAAILETAWDAELPNPDGWLLNYIYARYSCQPSKQLHDAWRILWKSVYSKGLSDSPIEDAPDRWLTHKALAVNQAETDESVKFNTATLAALAQAMPVFLKDAHDIRNRDSFDFDVVNITRQLLTEYAGVLRERMVTAIDTNDANAFRKASSDFLILISDIDELVATRKEYLFGRWLSQARSWGKTDEEKSLYEWNARNILTLWGDSKRNIRDYARRQWSGLLTDFYQPRWQMAVDYVTARLQAGQNPDFKELKQQLLSWEEQWYRETKAYPAEPRGDSIQIAARLWKKYKERLLSLTLDSK